MKTPVEIGSCVDFPFSFDFGMENKFPANLDSLFRGKFGGKTEQSQKMGNNVTYLEEEKHAVF